MCAHLYKGTLYLIISLYMCYILYISFAILYLLCKDRLWSDLIPSNFQKAPSLLTPRKPPSVPRQPAGHGGILIVQPVLMDASSTWGHRKAARPRCGCHCDIQKSSKNPTQDWHIPHKNNRNGDMVVVPISSNFQHDFRKQTFFG
jgi:hypothetical protein